MRRGSFKVYLLVGYFFLATLAATAQEVVHALIGTVSSINPAAKTITVKTDDGSLVSQRPDQIPRQESNSTECPQGCNQCGRIQEEWCV